MCIEREGELLCSLESKRKAATFLQNTYALRIYQCLVFICLEMINAQFEPENLKCRHHLGDPDVR
jgi:hypothetical protein